MTIEIHGVVFSPPCRLVYMTLDVLGIQYKSVYCHPFKGMNKTPEYLKLNPQHNIPALVDGKLVLNESRAIATYLAGMAGSYGGNSQLYPSDLKTRAVIDQRLHFDLGTFYQTFMDNTVSVLCIQKLFLRRNVYLISVSYNFSWSWSNSRRKRIESIS